MLLLGVITTPVFLYVATGFASTITKLANDTGAVTVQDGQLISWSTLEYPVFRYIFASASEGNIIGIIMVAVWLALFVAYYKMMKKRTEKFEKEEEQNSAA